MMEKVHARRLFLDARTEVAAANREWSISELGTRVEILDIGCEILEHIAASAMDRLFGARR